MTVLSTSKNAAEVGSASMLRALSTSAMAAAASPASWERRCRFVGLRDGLPAMLLARLAARRRRRHGASLGGWIESSM